MYRALSGGLRIDVGFLLTLGAVAGALDALGSSDGISSASTLGTVAGVWFTLAVDAGISSSSTVSTGVCAFRGAGLLMISCICFRIAASVGSSGEIAEFGLGLCSALLMSCRLARMMSAVDAPGIGILSGNHSTVSTMRSCLVDVM